MRLRGRGRVSSDASRVEASNHPDQKQRFFGLIPIWVQIVVPLLLIISAVLNVIALIPGVPFLEISAFLNYGGLSGEYSILHVVHLLWEHKLYPLVVLVVGFSVLFPPVKIALASVCLLRPMRQSGRERMLSVLGHLGRWSLLDVYVSLLLLFVLSKQGVVGVEAKYGLYCFLGAIILSMSAGMILHELSRRTVPDSRIVGDHVRPLISYAGWQGVVATLLALGAIAAIHRAFDYPLFQVNNIGFVSNTWSLRGGIEFLFQSDLMVFAMIMFLFLVLAPIAVMVALLIALFIPQPHRWRRRGYLISRYIAEWCMLDVFALAMVLYLSEQKNFVKLDIKEGIWFLFGSVLIFTLAINWAEHVMYRAIRRREDTALKKVTSPLSHKQSE